MTDDSYTPVAGKFIRGVAYSEEEQSIFLIEANHQLFSCVAFPSNSAYIKSVSGADFLEQAQLVTVNAMEVVKHLEREGVETVGFCTRAYEFLTTAGTCRIVVRSDLVDDLPRLALRFEACVGYPPNDAKRLEDWPIE